MHFKENARIVTSKLENVGRLDRVVVDPKTEAITHLIVKKGFLFTEDRVISSDDVDTTTEDMVVLKKGASHPDTYPRFEETEYVPMGSLEDFKNQSSQKARKLLWYHRTVLLPGDPGQNPYPADADKPLFDKKKRRNIPENAVALEEGAAVLDTNGKKLGEIQDIFAEGDDFKVTHILVASGWIKNETKLIPAVWVKDMFEASVRLYLSKATFENLPHADSVLNTDDDSAVQPFEENSTKQ